MSIYITPTTPHTLLKMAQSAARNSALMAHFIENQCQQKEITWAELAAELQISEAQLAKLALCRQPSKHQFAEEVAQAASYTKIEAKTLAQFLQPARKLAFIQKFLRQKRPSLPNNSHKGDHSMMIKRALAFGVALIAILFISAFIFSQPANADATLQVTSGEVVVEQTSLFNQATTVVVSSGETLTVSSSDTIEVQDDAAAVLYLFEGSTVELSENTVLELTELANNGSDHQIYMTLFNGHVINRVTKLLGINDAYEVRTPSSTASVRGTIFSVETLNENATTVNVTEGVVEVKLGNEVALVHAGEMVTAVTGQPLNVVPTDNPEMQPTATPTQEPTEEPTTEPTETPTEEPTEEPTTEPTEEPEAEAADEATENGNVPEAVPGNTPEDVPGNGNPPAGGGNPPGQDSGDKDNNGNTDNQGSDNADAGSGNADNGGDNGVGNDGSNNGNTDNQGSDNADAGSGNADNGGDNGVGNDDNSGSDNADNGSGNSNSGNGGSSGSGNGNGNGNGKP